MALSRSYYLPPSQPCINMHPLHPSSNLLCITEVLRKRSLPNPSLHSLLPGSLVSHFQTDHFFIPKCSTQTSIASVLSLLRIPLSVAHTCSLQNFSEVLLSLLFCPLLLQTAAGPHFLHLLALRCIMSALLLPAHCAPLPWLVLHAAASSPPRFLHISQRESRGRVL